MRSPETGVRLAPLTTIGIGGPARWCVRVESARDMGEAHAWAADQGLPVLVLAGGSNVIVADDGFPGLVLCVSNRGVSQSTTAEHVIVKAAAGERWDDFVALTVAQGLAGVECLSGIPGSVGGTPIQNVGAYGQEVAQVIEAVTVFDREAGTTGILMAGDCGFGYRTSRFKAHDAGRFIVCDVTFRLRRAAPTLTYPDLVAYLGDIGTRMPTVAEARAAVLAIRRRKGMVLDAADEDTRSVGSFFTNPVVTAEVIEGIARQTGRQVPAFPAGSGRMKVPAAWLLEHAGLTRGHGVGAVGLSSKHTLAVINRGGASAQAVVTFAAGIKRRVAETLGIELVPEPTFVGFGEDEQVRYLVAGTA